MPLTFSYKKTTQSLNYFAREAGQSINKMKALKLIYFADRYHLRKFGRPITNDEYFAMRLGPVASGAKDIAEGSISLPDQESQYANRFINPAARYDYCSTLDVDAAVFSESGREALEFAWSTFGQYDQFKLADLTHRYPEWTKHEAALSSENTSRVKMSYSDFLEDGSNMLDPCFALDDPAREIRREEIEELAVIHGLWN